MKSIGRQRTKGDGKTVPSLPFIQFFSEKVEAATMVFFSCDGCGDMLKKSQVDAHVYKCKVGCDAVSCVDCSVSFYGGEF